MPRAGAPRTTSAGPAGRKAQMATYQYRCNQHGLVETARPIGTAPRELTCPTCGHPARRVFSTPLLALADRTGDVPDRQDGEEQRRAGRGDLAAAPSATARRAAGTGLPGRTDYPGPEPTLSGGLIPTLVAGLLAALGGAGVNAGNAAPDSRSWVVATSPRPRGGVPVEAVRNPPGGHARQPLRQLAGAQPDFCQLGTTPQSRHQGVFRTCVPTRQTA